MNILKFAIIFALYLSFASLILLGIVWGLSDSYSIFFDILFLIRTPVLRMFTFGVVGITVMFIIIYLNYSKPEPIFPRSILFLKNLVIVLFHEENDEAFAIDLKNINRMMAMIFFCIFGVFLIEYLLSEDIIEWRKTVLELTLAILPIMIGATFAFLLSGPIVIITFYIGDLIKHYRS